MIHQILFWIGIALAIFLAITLFMPGDRKNTVLVTPAIFLMAAAIAKYLGM